MAKALILPALLVAALTAGCSLPPPKDYIGYVHQYQISQTQIVSPSLWVSREEAGVLRGRAYGEPLELRVEGNLIKGSRGVMPIELHVSREGNAVVARGIYGGHLKDLAICVPAGDTLAPPGEVTGFSSATPCLRDSTDTVAKMFEQLGDTETMAMLVAVYSG
ncbi:MAG: hypothetical protein ABJE95_10495 [Byssovorax sp.]